MKKEKIKKKIVKMLQKNSEKICDEKDETKYTLLWGQNQALSALLLWLDDQEEE